MGNNISGESNTDEYNNNYKYKPGYASKTILNDYIDRIFNENDSISHTFLLNTGQTPQWGQTNLKNSYLWRAHCSKVDNIPVRLPVVNSENKIVDSNIRIEIFNKNNDRLIERISKAPTNPMKSRSFFDTNYKPTQLYKDILNTLGTNINPIIWNETNTGDSDDYTCRQLYMGTYIPGSPKQEDITIMKGYTKKNNGNTVVNYCDDEKNTEGCVSTTVKDILSNYSDSNACDDDPVSPPLPSTYKYPSITPDKLNVGGLCGHSYKYRQNVLNKNINIEDDESTGDDASNLANNFEKECLCILDDKADIYSGKDSIILQKQLVYNKCLACKNENTGTNDSIDPLTTAYIYEDAGNNQVGTCNSFMSDSHTGHFPNTKPSGVNCNNFQINSNNKTSGGSTFTPQQNMECIINNKTNITPGGSGSGPTGAPSNPGGGSSGGSSGGGSSGGSGPTPSPSSTNSKTRAHVEKEKQIIIITSSVITGTIVVSIVAYLLFFLK